MCWFSYFGCLHWKIKELIYIVPMYKAVIFSHSKTFVFPHKHRTINDIFNIVFNVLFIWKFAPVATIYKRWSVFAVYIGGVKRRDKNKIMEKIALSYICVYTKQKASNSICILRYICWIIFLCFEAFFICNPFDAIWTFKQALNKKKKKKTTENWCQNQKKCMKLMISTNSHLENARGAIFVDVDFSFRLKILVGYLSLFLSILVIFLPSVTLVRAFSADVPNVDTSA